jgi:hypothetical protein
MISGRTLHSFAEPQKRPFRDLGRQSGCLGAFFTSAPAAPVFLDSELHIVKANDMMEGVIARP